MSDSLKTLVIIAFLILILWNLGAGLYYMLVDKGNTKRTVNALTRRIGLSVALILLVVLAIIWLRCAKGHFSRDNHFAFEAVAWYWHFVDVVWLGLFLFVYVI